MPSFWEKVSVNEPEMDVYASVPNGSGPFPAVVVAQHASGRQFIGHVLDEFVHAAGMLGHYHGGKGAGAVGHAGINVHLGIVD